MTNMTNKGVAVRAFAILPLLLFLISTQTWGQVTPVNASNLTSIYDIQYTTNPSGDSPLYGQTVTIRGVVTAIFVGGFTVAEAEGPWRAIYVYTYNHGPKRGHKVQLTGRVTEYWGLTEIVDVSDYHLLSVKQPNHIKPVTIPLGAADQESYESILVTVENVTVSGADWHPYNYWVEWMISDGSTQLRCSYKRDYMYFPGYGDFLQSVTGIVLYDYGERKLQPRETADIRGTVIPHYALRGTVVTMNKQRKIISNGYVEILGDRIIKVSQNKPACDLVYDVEGYILPGLIDAHNHPYWNVFGHIPFGTTFNNRYEWQASPMYDLFGQQYDGVIDFPGTWLPFQDFNIIKLGEIRSLAAGTTTWQGVNCNGVNWSENYASQGIGINNAERFPARIIHVVKPLSSSNLSKWPQWLGEYWERFMVHLCEGKDASSLAEFYVANVNGLVDDRLSVIHGVPLTATEYAIMAAGGSNLVWSPKSNVLLYGTTANIPAALNAGVTVALAPDWTESGEFNILDELRFAESWSNANWSGQISALQFTEFVTVNAAHALGLQDRIGSIEEGKQADLVVIPQFSEDPYADLLDTEAKDVTLTVVNGRPMYGNPTLMQSFPFLSDMESVSICGVPKTMAWVVWSGFALEGADPVSLILNDLVTAYQATTPKVAPFAHYDQCTVIPKRGNDLKEIVPAAFILEQNHPNPFNPTTAIGFSLTVDCEVHLTVIDALGRHVETLLDETRGAGRHTVTFDGSHLPSGMYLCTLAAGDTRLTKWMTLAK